MLFRMRYLVAITGASGICYGLKLLEALQGEKEIIVSETGKAVMKHETGIGYEKLSEYGNLTAMTIFLHLQHPVHIK